MEYLRLSEFFIQNFKLSKTIQFRAKSFLNTHCEKLGYLSAGDNNLVFTVLVEDDGSDAFINEFYVYFRKSEKYVDEKINFAAKSEV